MKTKTLGLTLAFCFLGWAACFAADPQMGTWKLNEAKSKITPGTTKFATATFQNMFGNVKITQDGTGQMVNRSTSSGQASSTERIIPSPAIRT
jgi:hypothetical protein